MLHKSKFYKGKCLYISERGVEWVRVSVGEWELGCFDVLRGVE